MSYRRVPFQFNPERSSEERRAEILRRFGFQPEEDNMFYETNSPSWSSSDWAGRFHRPTFYDDPEWRNTGSVFGNSGSMPGSPQSRMRRGWTSDLDEGGVPIKVVHEGASARGGDEGDAASETSSQGSRSSCSSGGRSNGPNNGASGSKPRHEPRVHHIPIMVEPRTGSSSSGYASDGEIKPNHARRTFAQAGPKDQAAAASAPTGEPRNVHTVPIEVDGYVPQRSASRDHYDEEMSGDSENMRKGGPFEMDCGDEAMARCRVDDPMDEQASGKNWAHTFPRQKCQQSARNTPTASKSSSGGKLGPQATSPTKQGSEPPPQQQQKQQMGAEDQIRRISLELADLRQQVLNFNGKHGDKQYKFLDEMLTRLMIKLDSIDPAGKDDVRKMRKAMVKEVQSVINLLEGKPPTYALVEVVPQEVAEAEQPSEMNQDEDEGANDKASDGAAIVDSAIVGDTSAMPEQAGKSNTPVCPPPADAQKTGSKEGTPMEVEPAVTSEAQPSQTVEVAPQACGAGEEPTVREPPAVPMPIDIDTSLAASVTNPIEEPNAGSASPFNEQNLSSLDNNSVGEATHLENTIPTEHSGTDL